MSCAFVTSIPPFFIMLFGPVPYELLMLCGRQNTGFFCFIPYSAVIVVPLLCFPSIINIPSDNALTILFLFGKCNESGSVSGGYSLIIAPPLFIILSYNGWFSFGYICLNPLPNTAIVFPPLLIHVWCAMLSIPLASPLIIFIFFLQNCLTNSSVVRSPSLDEFLEPTTAIPKSFIISSFPST